MSDKTSVVPVMNIGINNHLPVREDTHPYTVHALLRRIISYLRSGTLVQKGLPGRGKNPLPHNRLVNPVVDKHLSLVGVTGGIGAPAYNDLDPPRVEVGKVSRQGRLQTVDLYLVEPAHGTRILLPAYIFPEPRRVARLGKGHVGLLVIHPVVMGAEMIHHHRGRKNITVEIVSPYLILVHGILILILSIGFLFCLFSLGRRFSLPLNPGSRLHAQTASTNASE